MPTPSGQISLDQVNSELGISSGTQINMNATAVRGLAGVPTGAITMSNLQNKSNAPSDVDFLNTSTSLGFVLITSSSNIIISLAKAPASSYNATPVCPAPVILCITAAVFVTGSLVPKLGSSSLTPFL